ncbi:hypothetical protein C8R45DRAFT_483591 [Mycena sanguinolenta]|nr:hypothetical protein C8R45DRAFT_483591 [Mycena sanguinolenta]
MAAAESCDPPDARAMSLTDDTNAPVHDTSIQRAASEDPNAVPAWFSDGLSNALGPIIARLDNVEKEMSSLKNEMSSLKNEISTLKRSLLTTTVATSKLHNMTAGKGAITQYLPVPFPDGSMPSENALTSLESIQQLSNEELECYLRAYERGRGGLRTRTRVAREDLLCHAIGCAVR